MDIDEKLVRQIAKNARLHLSDAEVKTFIPQLADVLKAFSKLKDAPTKGVEPAFCPIDLPAHERKDEPGPCLSQDDALSLTPHKKDGFFKGPKAIDK